MSKAAGFPRFAPLSRFQSFLTFPLPPCSAAHTVSCRKRSRNESLCCAPRSNRGIDHPVECLLWRPGNCDGLTIITVARNATNTEPMNATAPERVIALDLHPLSFGYAVFEGPDELLDWGIRSFRHGVNAVKVPLDVKLASLLDRYGPDVVVIKEPRVAILTAPARGILDLTKRRRIPVRQISVDLVRRAFADEHDNKYQIASSIAGCFPELSPRLGPRRKVWEAEKYSMSIFDAASLGIAYFTHKAAADNENDRVLSAPPR